MQTSKKIVFWGETDGKFGPLATADVLAALGLSLSPIVVTPTPTPEPEKPAIAGTGRVVIGKSDQNLDLEYGVFDGTPRLIEIINREPDAFRFRGGNYPIKGNHAKIADAKKLQPTEYGGKAQPSGMGRVAGYHIAYFPDASSSLDYYWKFGDAPDEVFVPKTKPTPTPTPPAPVVVTPPDAPNNTRPVDVVIDGADQAGEKDSEFLIDGRVA